MCARVRPRKPKAAAAATSRLARCDMGNVLQSCAGEDPDSAATEQEWSALAGVVGSDVVAVLRGGTATELDLAGKRIGDVGVAMLAKVLPQCTALTKLDLGNNGITDAGASTLVSVLPDCKALQHLGLSRNQIGDSGAKAVSKALSNCETLTELSLSRNQIGDAGSVALTSALPQAGLTVLYLGSNKIGSSVKSEMSKMSSRYGQVGSDPVHNRYGHTVAIYGADATQAEIETALRQQTAREKPWADLTEVVGSDAVAGLLDGTMTKLKLKGSQIGDSGVATLAKVLPQCTALKELDLDSSNITDVGAATLFQVLPQCEALWKLSLSSNQIGDPGAVAAAESLARCERFAIHLYLSGNQIGDAGGKALMEVLPQSALTCLNLESNRIGPSIKSELSKMSSGVGMDGSAPVCNRNSDKVIIWP